MQRIYQRKHPPGAAVSAILELNPKAEASVPILYAGTSGWSYAAWKPRFYPANLPASKFLRYYATRLNSVEVNYTFRRFPAEPLLRGWIEATPPGVRFAIKAHQMVTHTKRLRGAGPWVERLADSLEPLREAGKLGPVLFQLPPNLKCDLALLSDFLAALPRWLKAAFEFRNASWFSEEVFGALRSAGAALCEAESESLETPHVETAGFAYLRLRKPKYSAAERQQIAERLRAMTASEAFVYFKHEESPAGALYAEELLKQSSRI